TNTSLTPGIYGALLDISRGEQLESLRFVVLAGEKSSADLIEKSLEKAPRLKLYNEYGPTETTIAAAANLQLDSSNTAIIGKPIANAGIYIIDNYENLTPIGIPGQLAISGKGLARGYLNNPELTNDKFKADFHHSSFIIHHSILYCTGDLAQWLPDGNIEFLGRIDQQVKIRGFRIELGEIEGRLAKHPGIKEAVVLMQEEVKEKGDKYLCAYVVSDDESVISQLREYLLKELPDYMIPSYFVPLEKIPLTPNGKVNREALPKPGLKIGESYRAPRNEIEMKLVEIWAEILGRDELPASQLKNSIGIDDNFFQLGGHSLKAIRLVSVLQKDFEVSLTDIFRHQTISSLAEILSYKKNTLQQKIAELKHRGKQKIDAQELMKAKEKFDSQQQSYREKIEKYRNIDFSERVTYRSILLTGATGYLGIHILKELLINCRAQIYLLIRGKNQEEAEQRLLHKIKFYFNETMYDTYRSRIHIVNGDIASDRFELSQAGYNRLAEEIDCVINPAAIVKHYGFYNDFLQVNVEGVRRLIEFAITGKKKDLNHISTLSVGSGKIKEQEFALFSEFDHNFNHHMDNHMYRPR
ncbi:MAG TPA: SDR family oxidoreductase, partial [Candidatus Deferrimicrobium sp.]|nr:SDR family oxidoreductase [Candidatus Deferrimicrobium sp.]